MPTREQMLADLRGQRPTREQMLADLKMKPPKEQGFMEKYGERYIRPTMQAVGGALGGAGGAALGAAAGGIGAVPGGVTGGALGYAGAEHLYKILSDYAGMPTKEPMGVRETIKDIGEGALMEAGGLGLGKVATGAAKAVTPTLKKMARPVWNVAGEAVETYMKKPQVVEKAIRQTPYEAGQELLEGMARAKNAKVSELASRQKDILSKSKEVIDIEDLLATLKKQEADIRGFGSKSIKAKKDIKNQIDLIENVITDPNRSGKPTNLTLEEANDLKRQLQKEAYYEEGPVKYYRDDEAGKVFKKAASTIKESIEAKVPEIKETNKGLKAILDFETDKKFKNALKPTSIESTMKNVQSDTGNKTYLQNLLKDADKALGTNMTEATQGQFAAKYFRDPDTISGYVTGRSKLLPGAGALMGGAIGGMPGAAIGGAAGGALASPKVLKAVAPKAKALEDILKYLSETRAAKTGYKALPYTIGREKE